MKQLSLTGLFEMSARLGPQIELYYILMSSQEQPNFNL